jgi:hypothetical protein
MRKITRWGTTKNYAWFLSPSIIPVTRVLTLSPVQVREIAAGIEYLHGFQPPVVHGDIRGVRRASSSIHLLSRNRADTLTLKGEHLRK